MLILRSPSSVGEPLSHTVIQSLMDYGGGGRGGGGGLTVYDG